jgi:hypothetical protein
MLSYKEYKLLNESLYGNFNLGIKSNSPVAPIVGSTGASEIDLEEAKKMKKGMDVEDTEDENKDHEHEDEDHEHEKNKYKKHKKDHKEDDEDEEDEDDEDEEDEDDDDEDEDEDEEKPFMKKNMKKCGKMMKKGMKCGSKMKKENYYNSEDKAWWDSVNSMMNVTSDKNWDGWNEVGEVKQAIRNEDLSNIIESLIIEASNNENLREMLENTEAWQKIIDYAQINENIMDNMSRGWEAAKQFGKNVWSGGGVTGGWAQAKDTVAGPKAKFDTAVKVLNDLQKSLTQSDQTKDMTINYHGKETRLSDYIQMVVNSLGKQKEMIPQMTPQKNTQPYMSQPGAAGGAPAAAPAPAAPAPAAPAPAAPAPAAPAGRPSPIWTPSSY